MYAFTVSPILTVLWFLVGECTCQDQVYVKEGTTAAFNCSVMMDNSSNIWLISWIILMDNKSKTEIITTCLLDKPCPPKDGKIRYKKQVLGRYEEQTHNDGKSLKSQLMIMHVKANMSGAVIECITQNVEDIRSDEFSVKESHALNVVPATQNCWAFTGNGSVVKILCQFWKMQSKIICDVFPELDNKISPAVSSSHAAILPDSSDVSYAEYKMAGNSLYNISCSRKYYPKYVGSYRFRVEVYASGKVVMTHFTNQVRVRYIASTHVIHESSVMNINNNKETNQAFYTLMTTVMVLGITGILVIGWFIWSRRSKCCPVDVDLSSNQYESIDNIMAGCPAQDSIETVVSDDNESVSITHKYFQQTRNNLPVAAPTPHSKYTQKNSLGGQYIDPCSSSPSLSRSSGNYITVNDLDDVHRDDDDDDDNDDVSCSSTSSMSASVCKEVFV